MGLSKILELKNRISKFEEDINFILYEVIKGNESYILDKNTNDQLFEKGINSLGVKISDFMPYSPVTVEIKKNKGMPYDRVTLKDEGSFYSSFYIDAQSEEFEIKANDIKTKALVGRYGNQILGLTAENLNSLIEDIIFPELLKAINKYIYEK